MADCLFVPEEVQKELFSLGLEMKKNYPPFNIGESSGTLVPEEAIADFIKETGVRIEKATTNYEEIYMLLGYMQSPLKKEVKEDYVDGVGKATIVDEEYQKEPEVTVYPATEAAVSAQDSDSLNKKLKSKLMEAIAALTELTDMLE